MKLNKTAALADNELVRIILVLSIIITIIPLYVTMAGIFNNNNVDKQSQESFERLKDAVIKLVDNNDVYSSEEIDFILKEPYVVVGYNANRETYANFIYKTRPLLPNYKTEKSLFKRPNSCNFHKSCLCFIKAKTTTNPMRKLAYTKKTNTQGKIEIDFSKRYDFDNANCIEFNKKIHFLSLFLFIGSFDQGGNVNHGYYYNMNYNYGAQQFEYLTLHSDHPKKRIYSESFKQINNNLNYGFSDLILSGSPIFPHDEIKMLSHISDRQMPFQHIYIDKVDSKKLELDNNDDYVYILIDSKEYVNDFSNSAYDFLSNANKLPSNYDCDDITNGKRCIMPNEYVENRIKTLSKLLPKDPSEYSNLIIKAKDDNKEEEALMHFFKYLDEWAFNDKLKNHPKPEISITALSEQALEIIKNIVEERIKYCNNEECKNKYYDACEPDSSNIKNKKACEKVNQYANDNNIYKPNNLIKNITFWYHYSKTDSKPFAELLTELDFEQNHKEKYKIVRDYAHENNLRPLGPNFPDQLDLYKKGLTYNFTYDLASESFKNTIIIKDNKSFSEKTDNKNKTYFIYFNNVKPSYFYVPELLAVEVTDKIIEFEDDPRDIVDYVTNYQKELNKDVPAYYLNLEINNTIDDIRENKTTTYNYIVSSDTYVKKP